MEPADKLSLDVFKNDQESHIIINQELCRECDLKPCLSICPAGLYSISDETGEVLIEYTGCLNAAVVGWPAHPGSWNGTTLGAVLAYSTGMDKKRIL